MSTTTTDTSIHYWPSQSHGSTSTDATDFVWGWSASEITEFIVFYNDVCGCCKDPQEPDLPPPIKKWSIVKELSGQLQNQNRRPQFIPAKALRCNRKGIGLRMRTEK